MPFCKVDCSIVNSTVWPDRDLRDVFLTALFMAGPWDTSQALATFDPLTGARLAFEVPAGWYGFIEAAGPAIVDKAGVGAEVGLRKLAQLAAPDPHSRTPDHEGRRLVRVDGGYLVLNFEKYRSRDYGSADRMRRYRERQKAARAHEPVTRHVTEVTASPTVTRSESDARTPIVTQAEAEAEIQPRAPAGRPPESLLIHSTDPAPEPFLRGRNTGETALLERFPIDYRGDVETALGASPRPYALERELAAMLDGTPGHGDPMDPGALGRAVREVLLLGGPMTGFKLRIMADGNARSLERPRRRERATVTDDDVSEFQQAARDLDREAAR